jgi:molecular chaperone GrpE
MNETDDLIDEIPGEEVKIPINDKRRFGSEGGPVGGGGTEQEVKEPQRSQREVELEARLNEETTRREAAESKLVGVQAKFEEAKANLEKETADMRARLRKTLEDRAKQSQFDFLKTLLPVLDNLNLAISASETDPSIEHLRDGVIGTARSFEQALLSVGVEPVAGIGSDFNPEVHEAIDMVEVDAEQDGKVTSEYQRGYKFGDQLLRPARVQVGRGRAQSAGE